MSTPEAPKEFSNVTVGGERWDVEWPGIGAGAVGSVYRVTTEGGKAAALKVLNTSRLTDQKAVATFQQEINLLEMLNKKGYSFVPLLYGSGEVSPGRLFLLEELMDKEHQLYRLPFPEKIKALAQLVPAMEMLTNDGIAMPDLQYDEVYWDGKQVKVVDWNLVHTGDREFAMLCNLGKLGNVCYAALGGHDGVFSISKQVTGRPLVIRKDDISKQDYPGGKGYERVDPALQYIVHECFSPNAGNPDFSKVKTMFDTFIGATKAIENKLYSQAIDLIDRIGWKYPDLAVVGFQTKLYERVLAGQVGEDTVELVNNKLSGLNDIVRAKKTRQQGLVVSAIEEGRNADFVDRYVHWNQPEGFARLASSFLKIVTDDHKRAREFADLLRVAMSGESDVALKLFDSLFSSLDFAGRKQLVDTKKIITSIGLRIKAKKFIEQGKPQEAKESLVLAKAQDPIDPESDRLLEILDKVQSVQSFRPSQDPPSDDDVSFKPLEEVEPVNPLDGAVLVTDQVGELRSTISTLEARVTSAESENHGLNLRLSAATQQIDGLNARIAALVAQSSSMIASQGDTIAMLRAQLLNLTETQTRGSIERRDDWETMKQYMEVLRREVSELRSLVTGQSARLHELEARRVQLAESEPPLVGATSTPAPETQEVGPGPENTFDQAKEFVGNYIKAGDKIGQALMTYLKQNPGPKFLHDLELYCNQLAHGIDPAVIQKIDSAYRELAFYRKELGRSSVGYSIARRGDLSNREEEMWDLEIEGCRRNVSKATIAYFASLDLIPQNPVS